MIDKSKISFNSINNQNSVDIKQYIFKVFEYWKLFLVSLIIALIVAKFMNDYKQKLYSLKTVISIKEENNPLFSSGTNISFNYGGASDAIETIKVILVSRTHNEKVVKKLNFYVDYLKEGTYRLNDVYGKTPFTIYLAPNKPQLYANLIKVDVISKDSVRLSAKFNEEGTNRLITYEKENTPISYYTSKTPSFSEEFRVNEGINTPFLNFTIQANGDLPVGESYYIRFNSFDGTVAKYKNVRVTGLTRGASLMQLQMVGSNKKRIVDYLNTSVKVLEQAKKESKIAYAVKTRAYIDTLFAIESDSLQKFEKGLRTYKEQNNIYDLSVESAQIYQETVQLEKTDRELLKSLAYLKDLEIYIKTHTVYDEKIPAPALTSIQDSKIPQEISKLISQSVIRESLKATVTDDYPGLRDVNNDIAITKNVLLENIFNLKANFNSELKDIRERSILYDNKLKQLPEKEQGLVKFQKNYELSEANFNYLKQKRYEAGTAIAANVSDIKIIDSAKDLGQGPFYPQTQFNYVIGLLLGFILPLFYIIIKEILDNKVHTIEEIERNYEIPVLGVVGRNQGRNNLVVFEKPKSSVAESFRAIRSNIQFLFNNKKDDTKAKTLLLTSSVSGEGKTMISINMATVFALSGKKTILLGMDFRKPKIYADFDMVNDIGIVNYLINQKSIEEIIRTTKIPNLDLILSGVIPPNPSELLLNENTNTLMNYLKETYDYIIIDTPPVGLVSDALELFKYSDANIYVIRQGYSEKGMMKMIDTKYKNKEVTNISYLINDFSVTNKYGYSYGYGYGYGYGKYSYGYHINDRPKTLFSRVANLFRPKK